MRVAAIVVVEPEDGVFALVQAGWGVEVERLIRVRYVQCDQSFWRDAVYRVQPGVVDQVVVREIAVLRSAKREDRVAAKQEIAGSICTLRATGGRAPARRLRSTQALPGARGMSWLTTTALAGPRDVQTLPIILCESWGVCHCDWRSDVAPQMTRSKRLVRSVSTLMLCSLFQPLLEDVRIGVVQPSHSVNVGRHWRHDLHRNK